jgi:hypothetical protein
MGLHSAMRHPPCDEMEPAAWRARHPAECPCSSGPLWRRVLGPRRMPLLERTPLAQAGETRRPCRRRRPPMRPRPGLSLLRHLALNRHTKQPLLLASGTRLRRARCFPRRRCSEQRRMRGHRPSTIHSRQRPKRGHPSPLKDGREVSCRETLRPDP